MSRLSRICLLVVATGLAAALVGCPAAPNMSSSAAAKLGPVPSPTPPPPRKLHMVAVGDIMLDRSVGRKINANGCASIVAQVAEQLRRADITFGNLECPLSTVGPHQPSGACVFRADPKTVKVLVLGGFDIVSLANNHTLNSGSAALMQTLDHLEEAGIAYVGAARQKERGSQPTFFVVQDMRIGFLAYTDLSFAHGSYSKVDRGLTELRAQITETANNCNLLVVSYHWGEEYRRKPTSRQVQVAHASIEAGADVVLGHHPHVLEGVGIYQERPIFYSMGNFVFDQRSGERMESAIFDLYYTQGRGWRVEVTPVWIPRSRLGPEYATGERQDRILSRFQQMSADLGTEVQIRDGRAYISCPIEQRKSETVAEPSGAPIEAVH